MSQEVLLDIRDVVAHYGGIIALNRVSLHVGHGELVALLGANGAGKTTLLRVASGLLKASEGSVVYQQRDIGGKRPDELVRLGLVHVPEGRDVLRRMSVAENLRLGAFSRSDSAGVRDDLEAVYQRFPILRQRSTQPAGTLSGGEQQQLAISRALMARPKLLLLDEPSLGLAPLLVVQVFELVSRLRDEGITILLVEQNARQALRYADRAYVMDRGHVVTEGRGAALLDDPRLPRAYFGRDAPRLRRASREIAPG